MRFLLLGKLYYQSGSVVLSRIMLILNILKRD